ncbi:Glycine/D-amino acid oxidase [Nonlabens sp. Hel1_33_55]|uniref:NAD(P)/FAD-dependent oxidoreductase n=1 Tax=Nonlabens sp. Hel1_33_55 TaxID=1336802 RepID=UPI000875BFBB|nr:FAD-binding oxidoreductase [Nonlabens sp. Hel1_33_55]SCY24747.1 Glycine/D-amino acid oxidase [Nonlabens sp. Hel1_33_55]
MKDVIIVGGGISGATLAWQWFLQGKSIHWIADEKQSSSHVAAGVFNPVVLKRFSPIWKAQEQLDFIFPFYKEVENYLKSSVLEMVPVWRRLHDQKERSTWIRKSNRDDLANLMITEPSDTSISGIEAGNGYGIVKHTGWLNTMAYLSDSIKFFQDRNEFIKASLDYEKLDITNDHVSYNGIDAKAIIFAEGNGLRNNPWFHQLPLQGNKGEILIIKCPGLKLEQIIKSSVFLMPYREDLFWVGATYEREYTSAEPSDEAREFLISKLETFLKLPYEIVDHKSGIRPTTIDRRPFLGSNKDYKNLYVFNGMGSRASLIAPWASQQLLESIYNGHQLPKEMDIARFDN